MSFHGALAMKPPLLTTPPMMPYLSYQSGGNDESAVRAGKGHACKLAGITVLHSLLLCSIPCVECSLVWRVNVLCHAASQEDIEWFQTTLMGMGGAWDITRYSQVEHGFTKWGPPESSLTTGALMEGLGRPWRCVRAPPPPPPLVPHALGAMAAASAQHWTLAYTPASVHSLQTPTVLGTPGAVGRVYAAACVDAGGVGILRCR